MRIGVSGASGHLGVATVAELVRRGGDHEIVGISRSPDRVSVPATGRLGDYAPSPSTVAHRLDHSDENSRPLLWS